MNAALAILLLLLWPGGSQSNHARQPHPITVGWHDELRYPERWSPIEMENKPLVTSDAPGSMMLTLAAVPAGWPYSYQWSGVTRDIVADIGRYPVLVAYVSSVSPGSYAHLEIEDRSLNTAAGPGSNTPPGMGSRPAGLPARRVARGTTVTTPGLSMVDLGTVWGNSARHMQIRLITGGKNEGASCTYSWVRFIRREDLPALKKNPHAPILSHVVETTSSSPSAASLLRTGLL